MNKRLISTGSPFEEKIGYSRAVLCDGWIFVAGTTGYDYTTMTMPETVEESSSTAEACSVVPCESVWETAEI